MKQEVRVEELALRHTFTTSRDSQDVVRTVVLELESGGLRGLGEASPSSYYHETVETVTRSLESLRGEIEAADPSLYHGFLERAAERLGENRAALCALDLALIDWVTRSFRQPLHRLLGLDPSRIPVSSFTIGVDTPERMLEKVREARGYPILKIKVGMPGDVDILRALRKESEAVFRVDANCGWTPREAIEKSRELAALGVEFIEQPLSAGELEAMEEVFRKSALPVIADESCVVPADVPRAAGRFHGINIKLVKCGGILPALRMVAIARALGLKVMYGCMIESSISITAAAQIGALADYLDLDGNILITNDPYAGARNEKGRLILPDGWVRRR